MNPTTDGTATQINIAEQLRQQEMQAKLHKFLHNYDIKIENDMKRRQVYHPPTQFFVDPTDASICTSDPAVETEKLYTISIPESRLRALIELEERMSRYIHDPGGHNLLENLMDKERQEAILREQNEGIQKAYEQYSMLLNLAGYRREY